MEKVSNKHDYKIIVIEDVNFEKIQVKLLNRNEPNPVRIEEGLDYFKADAIIKEFIEVYKINENSNIENYSLDKKGKVINKDITTVKQYLEIDEKEQNMRKTF